MNLRTLLPALLLAACTPPDPAPVVTPTPPAAGAPVASVDAPATHPDYVVDEPLPPFDEGGGRPRLVAQSAISSGGSMVLYEAGDGTRLLRFEDLNVNAAPELEVVLTKSATPTAADFADAIRVGALKGVRGNQNYLVSSKVALAARQAVAVISRQQGTVIAFAPLTAPKK
ncbi:MAG: DM13 domain-containing protein [Pseudomonadota bacterium]